jgi:cytochrome c oxidase subunit 1
MLYVLGFLGPVHHWRSDGLAPGATATDIYLTDTYFVVAHFHYVMVGGTGQRLLCGIHFWWPKMTGRLYPEALGQSGGDSLFIGFNVTFFPQFILGVQHMNRRYFAYAPEVSVPERNVVGRCVDSGPSDSHCRFLSVVAAQERRNRQGTQPVGRRTGLEWQTPSPPAAI